MLPQHPSESAENLNRLNFLKENDLGRFVTQKIGEHMFGSKHKKDSSRMNNPAENDQMNLPYWQRESYKAYKQIKHVQPKIDSTIQEFVKFKIQDSEERLV